MDYVQLGSTGLRVSVAGLGTGGASMLGLNEGKSDAEIVSLIHTALDLGVNLIDTAPGYGTEEVIGKALKSVPRDKIVLCTKGRAERQGQRVAPADVVAGLDKSLRLLGVDHVDVYMLHGLPFSFYDYARNDVIPALLAERDKGKIRHLGFSEPALMDYGHEGTIHAAPDPVWRVMMVSFHMMHQNARQKLFPLTRKHGVGTLLMFAVRSIFSRPEKLREAIAELAAKGELPQAMVGEDNPLAFLVHEGGASSVSDAAYRFVRHEPGVDVVLFGTGDKEHLKQNIASILKPPLPEPDRNQVVKLFGHLVGVGMDIPNRAPRPARKA